MIVVDTSAWIDYFNGVPAPHAELLDELLGKRVLAVGDLILAELLQGFATEQDAKRALNLLEPLAFLEMAGRDVAIQSAANHRRSQGLTVNALSTALPVPARRPRSQAVASLCYRAGVINA